MEVGSINRLADSRCTQTSRKSSSVGESTRLKGAFEALVYTFKCKVEALIVLLIVHCKRSTLSIIVKQDV